MHYLLLNDIRGDPQSEHTIFADAAIDGFEAISGVRQRMLQVGVTGRPIGSAASRLLAIRLRHDRKAFGNIERALDISVV